MTNKITVTSAGTVVNANVTPDTAMYYSNKSKEWATSDKIVDNTDYSSKYYANESKKQADISTAKATEVIESGNNAVSNIENARDNAITDITNQESLSVDNVNTAGATQVSIVNTAGTTQVANVNSAGTTQINLAKEQVTLATNQANIATEQATIATNKTSEVVASGNEALSNINNAKTNALTDITDSKNASISSIDTAKSEALTEIETLHSSSITDITNLKNTSVSNIITVKNNAIISITNQQTTSKNVLIDEGATQVGLIQNEGATQIANVQSTGFYMKDDQLYYINSQGEETKFKLDDIELNNPFSLFDSKYSDHELNNISWLKSAGQWNSGTVYVDAYNELLREYNDSTSVEKTEGSITFKRTPKGYKIALKDQETAINTKYANNGIAWYYIIDTVNSQFKLPRTKFGFEGLRTSVGDDIEAGLPNIKGDIGRFQAYEFFTNNPFYIHNRDKESKIAGVTTSNAIGYGMRVGIDASRSNSIYGKSTTVQPPATQMYLYFYVGETVQNANIIDAGRIEGQLANKVDLDAQNLSAEGKSLISGLGFPSNRYTDLTFGASGSEYTAPANGWYCASVLSSSNSKSTLSLTTSHGAIFVSHCFSSNQSLGGIVPITKNEIFSVFYTNATTRYLSFIYAEGAKND